ncbi:type IVB secretion system protein IcmH/DotU [candidate division CSSED10-310 bacterium]|uniref:Type IVB secretion system protein IcmH/DotU n=1 Tax=candidate division CSSED10-310 bacterium TaxID=2855610 RepID=A0ABV6Z4T3_UNCC1
MLSDNVKTQSSTRLSDLCNDSLMLILQLRATQDYGDPDVLRQRIRSLFERMERTGIRNGFTSKDLQMVKFALVAFIDETIVTSEWKQKEKWLANPLQVELFDRFDAGEEFFRIIEELGQDPHHHNQVLEVFYLCMTLGFKGKFQLRDLEKLRSLIDTLHAELRVAGKPSNRLSPHGTRKDEIVDVITKEIPTWLFGVVVVGICFLYYLLMTFLLSNAAQKVEQTIETMV